MASELEDIQMGVEEYANERGNRESMSILSQVRRQVVSKGKLRYGAASRLANLLGLSQYAVRRVMLKGEALDESKLSLLEGAVMEKTPLYTITAKSTRCTECGKPGHARGLCRRHYYAAWSKPQSAN